jgi:peptide/nickel transport system permease protein
MGAFIVRRLLYSIPTLFGVMLLTFVLFDVAGGDPVMVMLGRHANEREVQRLRAELNLDKPWYEQLGIRFQQLATLDFPRSYRSRRDVSDMIAERIGPTLSLTLPALLLATCIGVSAALLAGYFRGTWIDRTLVVSAVLGMSVTILAYIIFGQYLLAYLPLQEWGLYVFPIQGYYDDSWLGRWRYLALPILIQVVVSVGYDLRFYRTVVLEEMGKDYVRTALAKGLTTRTILFKHVLRNCMIPIVTLVMVSMPTLITGSILLENFFSIPGLGSMLVMALNDSDLPVIQAMTLLLAVVFIGINIVQDLLYVLVDPTVRLE